MQNHFPLVSIYTCVHNRADKIHRVFDSVKALDYENIEHIIINDASTDGVETQIDQYAKQANYPVKYMSFEKNSGKHAALNKAWDMAEGEFAIQLDDDDELLPSSISFLVNTYYNIPENRRDDYWCVQGRCVDQYGTFVGDLFPQGINEPHWKQARKTAKTVKGEKIGLQRKRYLDEYRFPEVAGVPYLPESMLWDQLNARYGTWYTNEPCRVYYINEGSNLTSKKKTRRLLASKCYFHKWKLMHKDRYGNGLKNMLLYSLLFVMSNKEYRQNSRYLEGLSGYKLLLCLIYPFAFILGNVVLKSKKIK